MGTCLIPWGVEKKGNIQKFAKEPRFINMIFKHIEKGINPKDDTCIFENDQVEAIFVGNGKTKSRYFKVYKSQYLIESFKYGQLIGTFIGFKITFRSMGSHGAPSLIYIALVLRTSPPMQGKRYTMSEWVKK